MRGKYRKLWKGAFILSLVLEASFLGFLGIYFLYLSKDAGTDSVAYEASEDFTRIALSVGSSAESRNITWYSNDSAAGGVEVIKKSDLKEEDFQADKSVVYPSVVTVTNDRKYYINKAEILNLEPDTAYTYRLTGENVRSKNFEFYTQGTEDFSFLLAGDPQIGSGKDVGRDASNWEGILQKAIQSFEMPSFLISTGDQVHDAPDETHYNGLLNHSLLTSLPMAVSKGNHDIGSPTFYEHFNMPNMDILGSDSGNQAQGNYWFVYNNTLFMNLNSNNTDTGAHEAFMQKAMEKNPEVTWNVVIYHHSIFSAGAHALNQDILMRQSLMAPLFTRLGIDVVLMGHDHSYTRTYIMQGMTPLNTGAASSVTNPDGALYVTVNSSTGSKYYPVQDRTFDYAAVRNQEEVPNISNVKITDTSFKITTYRSDLSKVDEFTIIKTKK